MGWDRFSIPSKAFVLGEYAVLKQAQALVATFAPRFSLTRRANRGKALGEFAAASPARLLVDSEKSSDTSEVLAARFEDPHQGMGGFGGSTAEFALAYAALHGIASPVTQVWRVYREIQPQASGADLAAQWSGGVVVADPVSSSVERVDRSRAEHLFVNFFVFSAAHQEGRKVRTHEHLDTLHRADLAKLAQSAPLSMGLEAARTGDFESFARAINDYADLLRGMNLEHGKTSEDRAVLRDVPGICAVKGTGAMQADAIVVFGDPELRREDLWRSLEPVTRARDLRLVSSGWSEEKGISA